MDALGLLIFLGTVGMLVWLFYNKNPKFVDDMIGKFK